MYYRYRVVYYKLQQLFESLRHFAALLAICLLIPGPYLGKLLYDEYYPNFYDNKQWCVTFLVYRIISILLSPVLVGVILYTVYHFIVLIHDWKRFANRRKKYNSDTQNCIYFLV